ncbi:hypothetical protein ACHAXT_002523 [Thalassiosira profunda]
MATLSMADAAAFLPSSRAPHSLCEMDAIYQSVPHSSHRCKIAMRASADAPLCVEAVIADSPDGNPLKNGWSTRTNRLERGEKRLGHDVTSARGWLEHLEQECGAGAYTVLRCDVLCDGNERSWRVWGLELHLDRLCSSYGALREIADWEQCGFEEEAKAQTNDIITTLLRGAELAMRDNAEASADESTAQDAEGEEIARTLMLTVLWTPPATGNKRSIAKPTIRGHAAFIGGASPAQNGPEDAMPAPTAACLGIPIDPTPEALASLPRRYSGETREKPGPSAKISSWCRERRPLEDPSRFKPPGSGVGEVLLVRQCKAPNNDEDGGFLDALEILEGLTSNLFVIYKDGTVRTAPAEKVLSGYARQLVMDELS